MSFVPETEQRFWRTLTRTRYQRTREKVRLQNQLEALLEEAHIKLSRHQDAVERLAVVPGLGVDSAQHRLCFVWDTTKPSA